MSTALVVSLRVMVCGTSLAMLLPLLVVLVPPLLLGPIYLPFSTRVGLPGFVMYTWNDALPDGEVLLLSQLSQPVASSWLSLRVLLKIGLRRVAWMTLGVTVRAGAFNWGGLGSILIVADVVVDAAGDRAQSVRRRVPHRLT